MNDVTTNKKLSEILCSVDSLSKSGSASWNGRCPAHADSSPSLSISLAEDDDHNVMVLMHCFAGCSFGDICEHLNLETRHLFNIEVDDPDVSPRTAGKTRSADKLSDRELQALYARVESAQDARGDDTVPGLSERVGLSQGDYEAWLIGVEGELVLFPALDIKGSVKGLRIRDFHPGALVKERSLTNPAAEDASWLPYTFARADHRMHDELVVTEGPIDGLTASACGYDVFAVFGTANATNPVVQRDLLEAAKGRTVVVCGDADAAGRKFSSEISRYLASSGVVVRVVEPPREKWDLNDWYQADREAFSQEFRDLIKASADVVTRVSGVLKRFSHMPDEAWYDVLGLWVVHAHLIRREDLSDIVTIAPRVGLLSAVPGSGKTETTARLATLIGAGMDVDPTPAVMVRTISASGYADDDPKRPRLPVPLAVDEIDNLYGGKNVDRGQLTTIMNSGYKRGSQFRRADTEDPKKMHVYDVFATVVYNGLAKAQLPTALVSRSFLIDMEKATKEEADKLDRYFEFRHGKMMARLAEDCANQADTWSVEQVESATIEAMERLAEVTSNRELELWSGLLTVAILMDEQSGSAQWVPRFWELFRSINASSQSRSETLSLQFLRGVRDVYDDVDCQHGLNEKGVWSETLIRLVCDRDDTFNTMNKGYPVTASQVAGFLGDFKISPKNIKMNGSVRKGYRWEDLTPVFSRYLSDDPAPEEDDN